MAVSSEEGLDWPATADPPAEQAGDRRREPERDRVFRVPKRMGRYRVERLLGRGVFAIVCKAYDEELQRPVAIKIAHDEVADDVEESQLHKAEAQRLARLKHPGIVPVYDIGRTADGRVFVVSQYIDGRNLQQLSRKESLTPRQVAETIASVAEALHHAHECGLVHRDVKPANILIDDRGQPHVTDFGLAIEAADQRFDAEAVSGSPSYMAPEQVRGRTQPVDARADVWALGVVLYETLTKYKPFTAKPRKRLFREITKEQPLPPTKRDASIPVELERITLRCLEKDPGQRYPSAADLAVALRRWSEDSHAPSPEVGGPDVEREPAPAARTDRRSRLRPALARLSETARVRAWLREASPAAWVVPTVAVLMVLSGFVGARLSRGMSRPAPATPVGQLSIRVHETDAEFDVLIDGAPVPDADLAAPMQLPVGRHHVMVRGPGLETEHFWIEISSQRPIVVPFALRRVTAE